MNPKHVYDNHIITCFWFYFPLVNSYLGLLMKAFRPAKNVRLSLCQHVCFVIITL